MMQTQKYFLLIFFGIIKLSNLFAQAPELNFQRIGVNDGLSQGSVRDILEDRMGFLWFATADGLNRYDGYEFHPYNHHGEDSTSIINGDVFKLFKDSNGDLWLSTNSGISKYNYSLDKFKYIIRNYTHRLVPILESQDKIIYTVSLRGDIVAFEMNSTKEIGEFFLPDPNSTTDTRPFFFAKDQQIFVFSKEKLYIFDTNSRRWSEFLLPEHGQHITSGLFFKNEFWLGNATGELLHYTSNFEFIDKVKIDNTPISCISTFGNKDLILGCSNGMYYYSFFNKEKRRYAHSLEKNNSLSSNIVQCFLYDNSGNLWIGTSTSGASKTINGNKKFKSITSQEYYYVKSIWKDATSNEMYCANSKIGVDVYDLVAETKLASIPFAKDFLSIQPRNNKYLFLFYTDGVALLNRETNIISGINEIFTPIFAQKPFRINAVYADNNKCYISVNQLIIEITISTLQTKIIANIGNIPEIISLFVENSLILLGTTKGLYRFKAQGVTEEINDIFVKSILKENDNSYWLGTTTGLYHYFMRSNHFKLYDEKYGLVNNFIYGILQDNNKNLWCSTNRGLSRFNPQREYFRNYGINDGIQAYEYNTGAFYKAEDGMLLFGGVNGVNFFDTDMIAENPVTPRPVITKIRVNDEELKTDTAVWNKNYLEFPFSKNTISFEFVGLQYTNTELNSYQYMMNGVDKDWISAGNRRFARYANLEPGIYTFKVKAANSDGKWNTRISSITINITAPFWKTWWFRILLILGAIALMTGTLMYFQGREIAHQKQQLAIQQRIISERERISRDLHDNIGAQITYIISSMDWAKSQIPKENEALQERFDHLRSNTQTLMSNLRDTIWTLNKKAIRLQDFFDRLRQYVGYNIQRGTDLDVHFEENIECDTELAPNVVLNLFRICQEAIQNVVKHANAQKLNIVIHCKNEKNINIKITDNGIGLIEPNRRVDSFGLDNMRYRATEIGAKFSINSEVGKGTTIEITLKI